MPQLDSYLFFDGDCAEAMHFYHRTLGGTLQPMMTYAQSPEPDKACGGAEAPDAAALAQRIMHACLVLDGRLLMASDTPPGQHQPMAGFSLSLTYPTAAEAARVFDALSQGGKVIMPMAKTFWVESFGMCSDRFGTSWMVGGGQQAGAPQA